MKTILAAIPAACAALLIGHAARADDAEQTTIPAGAHVPIEVVVVTTFELPKYKTGEFYHWIHDFPLATELPFPQGYAPLRYNAQRHVLGIETGEGPTHMAASITALANNSRFDFSHAYWLLAGIAGIDPNVGPAGSVAWASYIVDADLAYEIDAREIPPGVEHGLCAAGPGRPVSAAAAKGQLAERRQSVQIEPWPCELGVPVAAASQSHTAGRCQPTAVARTVYELPQHAVAAKDPAGRHARRRHLLDRGAAQTVRGRNWVKYWSNGKATFTMTSEEDAGYMLTLTFLAHNNQVDLQRVMDLRSASDFSVTHPGQTPAQLLAINSGEVQGLSLPFPRASPTCT